MFEVSECCVDDDYFVFRNEERVCWRFLWIGLGGYTYILTCN